MPRPAASSSSSSSLFRLCIALRPLRALAPALALGASGCLGGPYCTAEAVSSLAVTVALSDGADVDDATVTAARDGGESQACTVLDTGGYDCGFYEAAGTFTVTATKEGFAPVSETVTVEDGVCHVDTQAVALVLVPE